MPGRAGSLGENAITPAARQVLLPLICAVLGTTLKVLSLESAAIVTERFLNNLNERKTR
jgi:hypothetical protein